MCGIFAIFGLDDAQKWRQTALDSSKKLRHRGPDWSGVYCEGGNIICHERLAIVGIESGEQPIYSQDRSLVLGVNGEIYNHASLEREALSEEARKRFQTKSDCEVLLHLYEQDGPDFLSKHRVNGMFAFVLYDKDQDRFIAARDPIGVIPLYIGWGRDGSVWFASEMKALQTHCERFECFPPGHVYDSAVERSQDDKFRRWFCPIWWDEAHLPTRQPVASEIREAFEASVVRHLMGDVPMGVLLSGGLDSSLVAAVAARHAAYRTELYADSTAATAPADRKPAYWPRLHSFCIGLEGSPDLKAAETVAQHIGTQHHSLQFTVQQGLDALSDVIQHIETYDVTTIRSSTPMYLMARQIKAFGIKAVLSGEGADEMLAGYLYFHKAPSASALHVESVQKLKGLHQFDCLRANKAMMAFGVEPRVPFLDRDFLDHIMTTDPTHKLCGTHPDGKRIEKHLLRSAFDTPDEPFLPKELLWRQKEQFSDGVGYSWIDSLKAEAEKRVTDAQLEQAKFRFTVNPPQTKEAYMFREMFVKHFPSHSAAQTVPGGKSIACSTAAAIEWDAAFKDMADPSGRAIGVHDAAVDKI